jgi:membrane associated rhomboid family serine protease
MANFIVEDIKRVFSGNNHLSKLILINVGVFLLLNILLVTVPDKTGLIILQNIGLPAGILNWVFSFWTVFTYMFVHQGLFHLIFNLLWLYWFGRIMADIYNQNRVLQTYIYGGLAGGILYILFSSIPGVPTGDYLIGASGGVLAVMVATAALLPDYEMRLILIGPVKIKYIVLVGFILSSILDFNQNTGGKIAHIGGAAYGLYYGMQLKKGIEITDALNAFFNGILNLFRKKPNMRVVHNNQKRRSSGVTSSAQMSESEKQRKTDEILDKISSSGYESLTKEEKDFLFKVSKN